MNKLLSRLFILLVGLAAGLIAGLLLPTEQREQLSRQLAGSIGGMLDHCPDGGPGRNVLSGVHQTLVQNIEDLARLKELAPVEEA